VVFVNRDEYIYFIGKDFHRAVDEYLALCEEKGEEPEKPFKGSFNIRISPELHKHLFQLLKVQQETKHIKQIGKYKDLQSVLIKTIMIMDQ
jgi:predicted HicB family RNase H-like nuclease